MKSSNLCTNIALDFMSTFRQCHNLQRFSTFDKAIRWPLRPTAHVCEISLIHALFDSYLKHYTKDGERIRRAGQCGTIRIVNFNGKREDRNVLCIVMRSKLIIKIICTCDMHLFYFVVYFRFSSKMCNLGSISQSQPKVLRK